MSDATPDNANADIDAVTGDPLDPTGESVDDVSVRSEGDSRIRQARKTVAAAARARYAATVPARRSPFVDDNTAARAATLTDHARAYRAHLISAAAALLALVLVLRRRRTATPEAADLGYWHLVVEPSND